MSPVEELVGFTVRVSPDEHERLRTVAEAEHRSLGAQARKMLVDQLEASEPTPEPTA